MQLPENMGGGDMGTLGNRQLWAPPAHQRDNQQVGTNLTYSGHELRDDGAGLSSHGS